MKPSAIVRSAALFGPSTALLFLIATTGTTSAYPGDVFTIGAPVKGPAIHKAVEVPTGTYSVSQQTGSAQYSFSIPVPPGRNGMQPSLGLHYSSQNPLRGGVAAGWALTGVPSIEVDTSEGWLDGVRFKSNLAGGQRLVQVVEWPQSGVVEYRAESDAEYVRYRHVGRTQNTPGHWIALHPNGTTYFFGETPDSRDVGDDGVAMGRWMITRMTDVHGNEVRFNWSWVQASVYSTGGSSPTHNVDSKLDSVTYGRNTAAGVSDHARIDFEYLSFLQICAGSNVPTGAEFTFRNGVRTYKGAKRLERIVVSTRPSGAPGDSFIQRRAIELHYDSSADQCAQPRAPLRLLASIEQNVIGSDGTSRDLPVIRFDYGTPGRMPTDDSNPLPAALQAQSGFSGNHIGNGYRHLEPHDGGGWPSVQTMLVDMNGDARVDVLQSQQTQGRTCNAFLYEGNEGGVGSARPLTWPRRPWAGNASAPADYNPTDRRTESCSLTYQLDRRTLGCRTDCSSMSANYTSFRLMDLGRDGIPELVTALEYKPGRYTPSEDCADPQEFHCDVTRPPPCISGSGARIECVTGRGSLDVPPPYTVPAAGPPNPDGDNNPYNNCGDCDVGECTNASCASQAIDDGSCNSDPCRCSEDECAPDSAGIANMVQRAEVGDLNDARNWYGRYNAFGLRSYDDSVTGGFGTEPRCGYWPEVGEEDEGSGDGRCHEHLWRVHSYDPATRSFAPATTIYSPLSLETSVGSGHLGPGGPVGAYQAIIDIDGDRCVDQIYQLSQARDPAWDGDLQVFKGDCQGGFHPDPLTEEPYIWVMPRVTVEFECQSGICEAPLRLPITDGRSSPVGNADGFEHRFTEEVVSLSDVNGDGLPDYVRKDGNSHLVVYYNTGRGFESPQDGLTTLLSNRTDLALSREESVVLSKHPRTNEMRHGWSQAIFRQVDFDDDGLLDIVELQSPTMGTNPASYRGPWDQPQASKVVRLHVNLGDRFREIEPSALTNAWWAGLARITVSNGGSVNVGGRELRAQWWVKSDFRDMNGDGLADQIGAEAANCAPCTTPDTDCPFPSSWTSCNPQPTIDRDPNDHRAQGLRLLRSIDDGRGARIEFDYATTTSSDVVATGQDLHLPTPIWVVRRMDVHPGPTATGGAAPVSSTEYDYIRPMYNEDRHGQFGFRGFEQVRIWHPPNAAGIRKRVNFIYKYDEDYSGRLWKTRIYENGVMLSLEIVLHDRATLFGGAVETFYPTRVDSYTCVSPEPGAISPLASMTSTTEAVEGEEEDPFAYLEVPPEAAVGNVPSAAAASSSLNASATLRDGAHPRRGESAGVPGNGDSQASHAPLRASRGERVKPNLLLELAAERSADLARQRGGGTIRLDGDHVRPARGTKFRRFSPLTTPLSPAETPSKVLYSIDRYEVLCDR